MSKRLRNESTGVVVSVRDDKVLGSEWAPVIEEVKAQRGRPKKQGSEESDEE